MDTYEKKYRNLVEAVKELQETNPSDDGIQKWVEDNVPELKESEGECVRRAIICGMTALKDKGKETFATVPINDCIAWLEKRGKKKSINDLTPQEAMDIAVAKFFEQGEQKPVEWHREDEQNLNACLGYIPHEFLRRWLTDIIHVKYDKPAELPKGEDYGIDGLYAAIDILQKTLGKIDGYQTDDGILEHKCAISAVKELSKQQPAWSEEDESHIRYLIECLEHCKKGVALTMTTSTSQEYIDWLKSLRSQNTWKPSKEQIIALRWVLNHIPYDSHKEEIFGLLDQIKDL